MNATTPIKWVVRCVSTMAVVGLCWIYQAAADPLLWKVTASNTNTAATVYLFGSIHFGVEAMYPLPAAVEQAFDQSDYLAVEFNVLELDPVQASQTMKSFGFYDDGGNLKDALDAPTWQQLNAVATELGIPVNSFLPMRPWFAAIQLVSIQLLQARFREDLGVDRHFLLHAARQKPILELESLDSQLNSFVQLTPEADALFLQQTLAEYAQGVSYLNALSEAWQDGDVEQLGSMVFGDIDDSPAAQNIYQQLFVVRNEKMFAAVENYFRDGKRVFLVVGVGHLLGEEGLVAMLKGRGYRVEKL